MRELLDHVLAPCEHFRVLADGLKAKELLEPLSREVENCRKMAHTPKQELYFLEASNNCLNRLRSTVREILINHVSP